MSSHHFVKEGQEPALLILEPISFQVVESLLEWAPLVMVNEQSLDVVLSWGIKVDVVLCSAQANEKYHEQFTAQSPIEILITSPEQELTLAMQYLVDRGQTAVSIQIADPLALIPKLQNFQEHFTFIILSADKKWTFYADAVFKKWLASGTSLEGYLIASSVSVKGIERTSAGFAVSQDGLVEIAQSEGFWIGESL